MFCERGNIVRNGWRGTLVADTQTASYIEMIEAYAVFGQVIDQTQQAMKSGNKRRHVQNLAANVAINTNRFEKGRVVSEAIKIARARYIDAKLVLS